MGFSPLIGSASILGSLKKYRFSDELDIIYPSFRHAMNSTRGVHRNWGIRGWVSAAMANCQCKTIAGICQRTSPTHFANRGRIALTAIKIPIQNSESLIPPIQVLVVY